DATARVVCDVRAHRRALDLGHAEVVVDPAAAIRRLVRGDGALEELQTAALDADASAVAGGAVPNGDPADDPGAGRLHGDHALTEVRVDDGRRRAVADDAD